MAQASRPVQAMQTRAPITLALPMPPAAASRLAEQRLTAFAVVHFSVLALRSVAGQRFDSLDVNAMAAALRLQVLRVAYSEEHAAIADAAGRLRAAGLNAEGHEAQIAAGLLGDDRASGLDAAVGDAAAQQAGRPSGAAGMGMDRPQLGGHAAHARRMHPRTCEEIAGTLQHDGPDSVRTTSRRAWVRDSRGGGDGLAMYSLSVQLPAPRSALLTSHLALLGAGRLDLVVPEWDTPLPAYVVRGGDASSMGGGGLYASVLELRLGYNPKAPRTPASASPGAAVLRDDSTICHRCDVPNLDPEVVARTLAAYAESPQGRGTVVGWVGRPAPSLAARPGDPVQVSGVLCVDPQLTAGERYMCERAGVSMTVPSGAVGAGVRPGVVWALVWGGQKLMAADHLDLTPEEGAPLRCLVRRLFTGVTGKSTRPAPPPTVKGPAVIVSPAPVETEPVKPVGYVGAVRGGGPPAGVGLVADSLPGPTSLPVPSDPVPSAASPLAASPAAGPCPVAPGALPAAAAVPPMSGAVTGAGGASDGVPDDGGVLLGPPDLALPDVLPEAVCLPKTRLKDRAATPGGPPLAVTTKASKARRLGGGDSGPSAAAHQGRRGSASGALPGAPPAAHAVNSFAALSSDPQDADMSDVGTPAPLGAGSDAK